MKVGKQDDGFDQQICRCLSLPRYLHYLDHLNLGNVSIARERFAIRPGRSAASSYFSAKRPIAWAHDAFGFPVESSP